MKKMLVLLMIAVFSTALFMAGCNSEKPTKDTTKSAQTETVDKSAETSDTSANKAEDEKMADEEESLDNEDMESMDMDDDEAMMEEDMDEEADSGYTMKDLCVKVNDVSNEMAGGTLDEVALQQSMDTCLLSAKAYENSENADAAINAFVGHVMTACEDKEKASEWLNCYLEELTPATEAAMKLM